MKNLQLVARKAVLTCKCRCMTVEELRDLKIEQIKGRISFKFNKLTHFATNNQIFSDVPKSGFQPTHMQDMRRYIFFSFPLAQVDGRNMRKTMCNRKTYDWGLLVWDVNKKILCQSDINMLLMFLLSCSLFVSWDISPVFFLQQISWISRFVANYDNWSRYVICDDEYLAPRRSTSQNSDEIISFIISTAGGKSHSVMDLKFVIYFNIVINS